MTPFERDGLETYVKRGRAETWDRGKGLQATLECSLDC